MRQHAVRFVATSAVGILLAAALLLAGADLLSTVLVLLDDERA